MEMILELPYNYVEIEEEEMMYLDGGDYFYKRQEQWWGVRVFYTKAKATQMAKDMRYVVGMWGLGGLTPASALGFLAGLVTEWVREDIAEAASKATSYVQINWGYAAWPDIYYG